MYATQSSKMVRREGGTGSGFSSISYFWPVFENRLRLSLAGGWALHIWPRSIRVGIALQDKSFAGSLSKPGCRGCLYFYFRAVAAWQTFSLGAEAPTSRL